MIRSHFVSPKSRPIRLAILRWNKPTFGPRLGPQQRGTFTRTRFLDTDAVVPYRGEGRQTRVLRFIYIVSQGAGEPECSVSDMVDTLTHETLHIAIGGCDPFSMLDNLEYANCLPITTWRETA